jgi:transcriptional regulator with XRE-family HTH domain
MNAQETFAKVIRDQILAAGYSYKKFGDALGSIPHQTVSRWVNARGLPDFDRLAPIAKTLQIDYQDLYALWVAAVSERGRRIAGEPVESINSQMMEDLPSTRSEILEIKLRMEQLENELRRLNRKD